MFPLGVANVKGEDRYVYCGAFPILILCLSLVAVLLSVVGVVVADATGIKTPGENRLGVCDNREYKCKGVAKRACDVHRMGVVVVLRSCFPRLRLRFPEKCGEEGEQEEDEEEGEDVSDGVSGGSRKETE